jgi:hypothetical protein
MILGGIIRIFANQWLFELVFMGHLWSDHPYFLYIYKVLGAFVIFTGISFLAISKNISQYQLLIKAWSLAFLIIGIVMLFSGLFAGLHIIFYLPDFVFCFVLALFLFMIRK